MMRLKPRVWFLISLLLFAAAIWTWQYAGKYAGRAATNKAKALPQPPLIKTVAAIAKVKRTSYRLRNTTQTFAQLLHNGHALILRNALIDTEVPVALDIPAHLRAKGAPGSYLVQADRPLDKDFYAELSKAGATYISYVPNNAALVQASPSQATNLAANADVVAVLPYDPYYKLDSTLLPSAVEQQPGTNTLELSVTTFPGQRDTTLAALTQLGANLIGEDRSPFGPTLVVSIPAASLVAVAQLPLAQEIETHTPRHVVNDLTRVIMNVASNTLIGTTNYLGLTGSNVTVNLNDTGVDITHPDFSPAGRVTGDALTDGDGHGTHVGGIIAGNGSESTTVTNYVPGSITTNGPVLHADFRGKAINASLYVQGLDLTYGPFVSDSFLQENASVNLGPTNLISNNSWDYSSTVYDMNAASYDAATRDAQPDVDGEQPLLFVFAAGNNGNGAGTINSPATAKNVITVAASDSPRFITNEVYEGTNTNDISQVWLNDTDNTNYVASFSSAGNVDVGVEGTYGRFKPDVVAPGVFTVSCRSSSYVDPTYATEVIPTTYLNQSVTAKQTNYYAQYLPADPAGYTTSGVTLVISSNAASPIPFPPNMVILAGPNYPPTTVVSSNDFYALTNFTTDQLWWFGVTAPTNSPGPVNYNLNLYLFETNYLGDYFTVLSNLNSALKPYYLYNSGTSMSAGAVSGMLALMQQFVQSQMHITNPSPALLKAMLINGSRSMNPVYDFNVNTDGANVQGWGLPNLTNSIPSSLTNTSNPSMIVLDQSPSNALATGQYRTYMISCSDSNAATVYPFRISLVWTDPPGNPAAGVALVNNLELTVADATGSNIYIGNDFTNGEIFTQDSDPTNLPAGESDNVVQNVFVNNGTATFTAAGDYINNVQNVYINPASVPITFPLTVTISGTRVNVNAVTTQTNNIMQDFALVISSDDPVLSSPLTIVTNPIVTTNAPLITVASNGVPLLHQRLGANEPNLYSYPLSTNGSLSQWHFFIFTNYDLTNNNATNVAFATFLPPNLSIPRASGTADVDLYVYAPPTPLADFASFLANLNSFAQSPYTSASVSRTGTQSIIYTNSTVPVYYIGVESEDQQASDFGFYAVAQSNSFSTLSSDGNTVTATGTSLPVVIPTSLSPTPALAFAFMFNPNPVLQLIRRVTVTDGIQFGTPGSLYGTLQHDDLNTVLNNFSGQSPGFTNTYDDLQEDPNSGDVTSDGPGSLTQYVNQQANGLWLLAEANDDQAQSGYITTYSVAVNLQQPTSGFFITIPGNSWFDDYAYVPNDTTNMIIYTLYENAEGTNTGSGPIGIYLTNTIGVITASDYGSNGIVPPGGSLSLGTNYPVPGGPPWPPSTPPLAGGFWYYGITNSSANPVTLFVVVDFEESLTPNLVHVYSNNVFTPLTTDAHTQSQICITNAEQLVALQVGVRINDTNTDDLVLHLTSPEGTSVLLFEDRGGLTANGLGLSLVTTNGQTNYSTNYVYTVFTENTNLTTTPIKFAPPPFAADDIVPATNLWSNSFETVSNGVYTNGAILEGWLVTNNVVTITSTNTNGTSFLTNDEVGIVTDPNGELIGTNTLLGTNYLALTSGRIIQTFGVTNTFKITNGMPYELVFYAKPLGITDWWPADDNAEDIVSTNNGTIPYSDVTYDVGEVDRAFTFSGVGQNQDFYTGNEVDFGTNAGNFGTNNFTVDFWIREPFDAPSVYGILEKRQICQGTLSAWNIRSGPVNFAANTQPGQFGWEVDAGGGPGGVFGFASRGKINDGFYHHAAFTRNGLVLSIYIDGILDTNTSSTVGVANLTNTDMFRAGQSVCVSPGIDGSDATQPLNGNLDELDLFNRALSPAEIYAIYHAGSLGKYNTNSLLPNFDLTIDGVETNNITLSNFAGGWELFTNSFIATNNQITVEFSGNTLGVLLDSIQLVQLAATNYNNAYLPEEPLTPFVGENPLGCWTLDVWDTRDDSSLADNGALLSWTLQMTTSSTNATLYVLTNEFPITITNAASNGISYFAIDVPYYATYATNILSAISGGPLTLYFDQTALPTGGLPGDVTLQGSVPAGISTTNVLSTIGALPPLLPGQRYFLGVQNNGPNASFTIEVNFNGMTNIIIPLTNGIPFTNVVGTNGSGTNVEYYSFLVPTNAALITFQILDSTNGEVDLYARDGLPVPGPLSFDYESRNAGTNDQFIVVTTNSVPVPLPVDSTTVVPPPTPSTWYLAAYNFAGTNTNGYTIIATVVTNGGITIIPLTNNFAYSNSAAPGYPTNLFYSFTITNTNSPAEVQFTVTNLTNAGNVQLLASLNSLPTPDDFYSGSFNAGTNAQIIQITTNAQLPSLTGVWYLAVPNTSGIIVPYSIEATTNLFVGTVLPPIEPLTWTGAVNGTPDGNWDILTTSNWVVTGSNPVTNYAFQNGSAVTFDDSVTTGTTLVNLTGALSPASINVNNDVLLYTFIGGGNISGAPLTMNNTGTLIIDNSSANSFSSIALNDGTLQVGNNDANGSLGASPVDTGTGSLIFDRTDNILVPNVITDDGSLSQVGTGTLTLSGTNTYSGQTLVSDGTLVVDNTNALGTGIGNGAVFIDNGGTLDLGGLAVANGPGNPLFAGKIFEISGAGVGGNGAVVNNGPNQQQGGLDGIFLGGDATIGGTSRWDVRNGVDDVALRSDTLTKTGSNQISFVSTFVTGPGGNIIINQGILSFEATPFFSTSSGAITVNSNGLVGQNLDTLGSFTRTIVLDGGGTTNLSGGGITYLDAPIQLANNSSLGNGAGIEIFNGIISGSFGLTNLGNGSNLLSATNTYSGATLIAQGTLALTNTGSITNSTNITVLPGATLDASQRIDQTLTLASNQILFDNGTVLGSDALAEAGSTVAGNGLVISNLTINPGAVLSPGAAAGTIGTLAADGTAFLEGTTYMKINQALAPGQINDVLSADSIVYGGTLIVTNLGVIDSFAAGDRFTLFITPNSSGAFSVLILPSLPAGLAWSTTFGNGRRGILTVVTNMQPEFSMQNGISLSGSNVIFNGSNGVPGGQYVLLTSTNLLLPLTNWTPIATDYFDSFGNFNLSNLVSTNPAQFFILQSP